MCSMNEPESQRAAGGVAASGLIGEAGAPASGSGFATLPSAAASRPLSGAPSRDLEDPASRVDTAASDAEASREPCASSRRDFAQPPAASASSARQTAKPHESRAGIRENPRVSSSATQ